MDCNLLPFESTSLRNTYSRRQVRGLFGDCCLIKSLFPSNLIHHNGRPLCHDHRVPVHRSCDNHKTEVNSAS